MLRVKLSWLAKAVRKLSLAQPREALAQPYSSSHSIQKCTLFTGKIIDRKDTTAIINSEISTDHYYVITAIFFMPRIYLLVGNITHIVFLPSIFQNTRMAPLSYLAS